MIYLQINKYFYQIKKKIYFKLKKYKLIFFIYFFTLIKFYIKRKNLEKKKIKEKNFYIDYVLHNLLSKI